MANVKFAQEGYIMHELNWDGGHLFSLYIKIFLGDTIMFADEFVDYPSIGWQVIYDEEFTKTLANRLRINFIAQNPNAPKEEYAQLIALLANETFCEDLEDALQNFCGMAFYNSSLLDKAGATRVNTLRPNTRYSQTKSFKRCNHEPHNILTTRPSPHYEWLGWRTLSAI